MRILVFMSDNRQLNTNLSTSNYNSLSACINKEYCKLHGYDFIYYQPYQEGPAENSLYNCKNPITGAPRHASWSKILASLLVMRKTDYNYFVYIDSDCIFRNFSIKLETVIEANSSADILFMNNRPWNHDKLCAGFYILKNVPAAKNFLKDCYMFNSPYFDKGHHWEQEAFRKVIEQGRYSYSLIDTVWFEELPGQQLRHVASHQVEIRIPYFTKIINDSKMNYSEIISSIEFISFPTDNLRMFLSE